MAWNWKRFIPRVTWKSEAELLVEAKSQLVNSSVLLSDCEMSIKALNIALANAQYTIEGMRDEVILLLSAIALQHGGELVVKGEFFESLADGTSGLGLRIAVGEDKSRTLKLVSTDSAFQETEEDDAEEVSTEED